MVKLRVAAWITLGLAAAGAQAFPATTVRIGAVGQWSPNRYGTQTREECARFRPSETEVRAWFRRAKTVTKSQYLEETEWTQCSAKGEVASGGKTYIWLLDQSGRGSLSRAGQEDVYLSGPELRFRPGKD